jgi:LETM1 and EF-hand domain-containing protein 1
LEYEKTIFFFFSVLSFLQLEVTVGDSIRLVPFLVIAVVPFLEFSLPFLLKLFPNMLPSTYYTKDQKAKNLNASVTVRLEMAKFLKSATSRMLEGELTKELTSDAAREFLSRAAQGKPVSNAEIIKGEKRDEFGRKQSIDFL